MTATVSSGTYMGVVIYLCNTDRLFLCHTSLYLSRSVRRDAYSSVFDDVFKGLAHYTSKGELEFTPKTEEQKSAADPTAPIERPKVVLKGTEQ